ncbi:hypothetical protein [Streptomyces exfoliatus]|uniref:hypothetical protein n=1 Tax=Streptomyces exfoliatus TaxID=1905 RepID=UPI0037BD88E6
MERERAEPDHADETGGVLPPVPQGSGEVGVGGEVGGVRLHLRGDVGKDVQELLVQARVRLGQMEVDPHQRAGTRAHPALPELE